MLDIYEGAFSLCPNLHELRYTGYPPTGQYLSYEGVTATIYYPDNIDNWNDIVAKSIAGITWKSYTPDPVVPSDYIDSGRMNGICWTLDRDYKLTISG
jgi:hypothetical protein